MTTEDLKIMELSAVSDLLVVGEVIDSQHNMNEIIRLVPYVAALTFCIYSFSN